MSETFMGIEEHFEALLAARPQAECDLYNSMRHMRTETAFVGRKFIIYEMDGREPKIIDRIHVSDFVIDEEGASTEVTSELHGSQVVSYAPTQLFEYPIMVWLPLNLKLRWSAPPSDPLKGSLAFPFVIRTKSRYHLRERGIIYCETGPTFGGAFDNVDLK